jgi:uncharacterized protein (DUF1800 family)
MTKLRTPYELQVAAMRAMERAYPRDGRWPLSETLGALRHRPWERGAPDGYPDESAAWMGPDAMRLRLETAQLNAWALLELGPLRRSALGLADQIFGAALSRASRQAIAGASDLRNGIATLFMTPEFQRR